MKVPAIFLTVLTVLFLPVWGSTAKAETFDEWRRGYVHKAVAAGLDRTYVERTLSRLNYIDRVIELDRKQPDGQMSLLEYVERTVSPQRIQKGRQLLTRHRKTLYEIEQRYGVPGDVIVALWGKESEYGGYTGTFDTLSSLATLSYEGRRREFFEKELLNALILQSRLKMNTGDMKGSWAGAVGQCQFMPSNYLRFGVDGNNNGRVDLWHEMDDIFASMANLLRHEGWHAGQRWGQRIRLTKSIPDAMMGRDKTPRSLDHWQRYGVKFDHAVPYNVSQSIRVYQPDGPSGPAYALYPNFDVLMRWNRSGYFATAVGRLSDHLSNL